MNDRELMQMVLDYLDAPSSKVWAAGTQYKIIQALRARLAQPEPEPVAWRYRIIPPSWTYSEEKPNREFAGSAWDRWQVQPLYTAPPQREWQGLTDEEYETMAEHYVTNCYFDTLEYARAIEAALRDKNA